MLYESYKSKLEKRRRRFERFWRFRLLFLFALLMLLAAAAALMGVAGTVTAVSVPPVFAYGEPLSMQASSVFGAAEFEYRLKGTEEWSGKAPRAAGLYECRAVGTSIAGTARPGEIYLFSIAPMETVVRVTDTSLVFGEEPTFSASLCYDDVLKVERYTMEEKGDVYNIVADLDAVSVLSADGEDVTASYILTADGRDVREIARPLTVKTASETVEYDGKPHTAEELTLEGYGLAAGHRIEAEFLPMVNTGKTENRPETFRILDRNDNDVTDRYDITADYGTLIITKRQLSLSTVSAAFSYDGQEHIYEDLAAEGLAEGQEVRRAAPLPVQNAGEYKNAPEYAIYDGDGNEISKNNYEITTDFGTVTVEKRALAVSTMDEELTYDGQEHTYGVETLRYAETPLAEGQEIRFTGGNYAFTAANEEGYLNDPTIRVFAGEADVTKNYDVTVATGTIVIHRRALALSTEQANFVYDGQVHIYGELNAEGLAEGQEVRRAAPLSAQNVGEYENAPEYAIFAGETQISKDNYEITTDFGTVTITKRALALSTEQANFVYDGQVHIYDGLTAVGLADGQEVRRAAPLSAQNVGEYENAPEYAIFAGETQISKDNYNITETFGTVTITKRALALSTEQANFVYDGQVHIYAELNAVGLADGQEVRRAASLSAQNVGEYANAPEYAILAGETQISKDNYEITTDFGTIVIEKRALAVTTMGEKLTYDGQVHIYNDLTYDGVADGQEVKRNGALSAQNVGNYDNTPNYVIYDGDGNEISKDNYEITTDFGTVTITKRALALSTEQANFVYDGQVHIYDELNADGLADGQRVERAASLSAQNVGEYENAPAYSIFAGEDEISKDNYEITTDFGTIVITKRALALSTEQANFVYDGQVHIYEDLTAVGLADGQEVRRAASLSAQNVGEYANAPEYAIFAGETQISKDNYEITTDFGTVSITQRPLSVTTMDEELTYDGQEHKYGVETLDYAETPLAEGQEIRFTGGNYAFTAANEEGYLNDPTIRVFAGDADVTENYALTVTTGKIFIYRRGVTLRAGSYENEYDGMPHTAEEWMEESGSLAAGHRAAGTYQAFTDVQTTDNDPSEKRILDADGHDVTENYDVKWEKGSIVITKRAITLQAGSYENVYDGAAHSAGKDQWVDAASRLVLDHYADAAHYDAFTAAGEYDNIPQGPQIYDGAGRSVTDNYDVTWEKGSIVIKKREVTLETESKRFVYDAQPHSFEKFEELGNAEGPVYDLVEGHRLSAKYPSFTNVKDSGTENNVWSEVQIFAGGDDVTSNYTITWKFGTVTVTPRPITVTSGTERFVYDGEAHQAGDFTPEAHNGDRGLAEGHRYSAKVTVQSFTNVSQTANGNNVFEYSDEFIGAEGGENCIENYEIAYISGTVTIVPRPVTVTTRGEEFTYDGKDHSYNDIEAEKTDENRGLAPNQNIKRSDTKTWRNAGKYTNRPTYAIYDAAGKATTENYQITEVFGTVNIKKRPITVKTESDNFTYDGADHSYDDITADATAENKGLAPDQSIKRSDILQCRDAGDYTNKPTFEIYDASGETTTENYEITEKFGTVVINRRPITVTTRDDNFTYDGADHSYDDITADVTAENKGLAAGQNIKRLDTQTWRDAGDYTNKPTFEVYDGAGEATTKNYEITEEFGTVVIKKRPLHFTAGTQRYVYDDTEHSCTEYEITDTAEHTGLVQDHKLVVTEGTTITDVGEKTNVLTVEVFDGDAEVTENYEITQAHGTLTVTRRKVKLLTRSDGFMYDGKPRKVAAATSWNWGEGWCEEGKPYYKLAEGHSLAIVYPEFTDASFEEEGGKYVNKPVSFAIVRGDGSEVDLKNYDIDWEYGTVEITRRKVALETHSGSFVYDTQPHTVETYTDLGSTGYYLVEKHLVFAATYAAMTNVWETAAGNNVWEGVYILSGETDVTKNYEISWANWGTITITPRPVTLTSDSGTHIYDDTDFFVDTFEIEKFNAWSGTGLAEGHALTASVTAPTLRDVGTRRNELQYTDISVMADERDVTRNYVFEGYYVYNDIEVTPRRVGITTGSGEFVYDGNPHSVTAYVVEAFHIEAQRGLVGGHVLTAKVTGAPTVSTVAEGFIVNAFALTDIQVMAGERDVTQNYEFEYPAYGTLRITPRPVTVTVYGGEKVYCGVPQTCENFATDKAADYADEEDKGRGLVEGHTVRPVFPSYLDAGTYPNKLIGATSIVDALGREVSDNYTVIVSDGEAQFVITRRPVKINDFFGGTWVYDGMPHSSNNFSCEEENGERGLLTSLGHVLFSATGVSVMDITDIMEDGVYTRVGYAENSILTDGDGNYMVVLYDATYGDVTSNYEVELGEFMPLRVKSPIVVYVFAHTKRYDGTPLTYDPAKDNYFIERKPADLDESQIRIVLGGSITDVGYLTYQQVGEASRGLCSVWNGDLEVTAENRFEFTGPERALEVQRRLLYVRAADVNVEPTAETYYYTGGEHDYGFTFGSLLEGHTFTCSVYGVLTPEENFASIEITGFRITDSEGHDVTDYYEVKLFEGTLRWVRTVGGGGTDSLPADIRRRTDEE